MAENYKTCQRCRGKASAAHEGHICPLCGQQTMWNYVITPESGRYELTGYRAALTHTSEWWMWNWPYLGIFILATLGSLIAGFIPGWGGVTAAVCAVVATDTGFKAGVKYHKEVTR